jgi:heterodisulfide reductase subunit B
MQVEYGLPIYYLSDLIGLALGIDESALGIDRHFVRSAARS